MNVQHFLEEAFERGEKMKSQVLEDVLNSKWVTELLKNERFLNAVMLVLNAKTAVEKQVQHRLNHLMKRMELPTRDEIRSMEKKILTLENEIETLQRKNLSQSLKSHSIKKKAAKVVKHPTKR
ncbi:MAG: hypothetical protein JNK65_08400 [Deltaproteobacteria bacterium]|nr:hypothetical protein [Deltaproteobacteria bacterium]